MNPFLSPNTENRAWIFASGHLLSLILLCNSCAIIRAVLYCLLFGCTLGSPAAVRTQQLRFQTRQHSAVGRASQVLPPRPDMWVHACNPSTCNSWIPGAHWPANLADLVSCRTMRDPVSKYQGRQSTQLITADNSSSQGPNALLQHLHLHAYRHTKIHVI